MITTYLALHLSHGYQLPMGRGMPMTSPGFMACRKDDTSPTLFTVNI